MEHDSDDLLKLYDRLLAEKDARIADLEAALEFAQQKAGHEKSGEANRKGKGAPRRRPQIITVPLIRADYGVYWPIEADDAELVVPIRENADEDWSFFRVGGIEYPHGFEAFEASGSSVVNGISKLALSEIDTTVRRRVLADWYAISEQLNANPERRADILEKLGPAARRSEYRRLERRAARECSAAQEKARLAAEKRQAEEAAKAAAEVPKRQRKPRTRKQ